MCGINGIVRLDRDGPPVDREELLRVRDSMASRGPDGTGAWISPDRSAGLGHRRLAIIDLTDAGLQPMEYERGRYRIVFNGEIYNYRELRRALAKEGVRFASHSDTEVLLALYARKGPAMLPLLRGMYAFAIWDERERRLFLARDPYGIKPLYVSERGGWFRFASQVKALEAGGSVPLDVDPAGVVGFLLWGSVPEPWTLRRHVRALPAGHYLIVEGPNVAAPRPHHRFGDVPAPTAGAPGEALEARVAAHLVADVPVGVFLSAGLDSAVIAALASRVLPTPPTMFTLRFEEFRGTAADEAPAAEIAKSLGAEHVERFVSRDDFLDLWPRATAAMDQPSIDGFNTFVVSAEAHAAGLKVVLSGLGGDELFGGYTSFRDVANWQRLARFGRIVPGLRTAWPRIVGTLAPGRPKLAGLLAHGRSLAGSYYLRRGLFLPAELPSILGPLIAREGLACYDAVADARDSLSANGSTRPDLDPWVAVHLLESSQYMRNQLLRDSDWASMAHSLELRVPLVDAWLREQIAALGFEPSKSGGKAAVVREAAPGLPEFVFTRPKTGFSIPVMQWLDRAIGVDARPGLASRRLALKVLDSFGIPTARAA